MASYPEEPPPLLPVYVVHFVRPDREADYIICGTPEQAEREAAWLRACGCDSVRIERVGPDREADYIICGTPEQAEREAAWLRACGCDSVRIERVG